MTHKRLMLVIGTAAIGAFAMFGAQGATAATIQVTNTNDSGAGSLRVAINQANHLAGPDQIAIEATGTIQLQPRGLPTLRTAMSLDGPGAGLLSLDGSAVVEDPLAIGANGRVAIRGISIEHGYEAIFNAGVLDLVLSRMSDSAFGIRNFSGGTLTVSRSSFGDNGDGILNEGESAEVRQSTFTGGACGIESRGGELLVSRSTISGVTSSGDGCHAGILISHTARVERTTIDDNAVPGILNFGSVTVAQSTVGHNSSYAEISNEGVAAIARSTIVGSGGSVGILGGGFNSTTLKSTIVAGDARGCDGSGLLTSLGHNLSDDATCNLAAQGDQPNTTPNMKPLGDYGGPTETYALRPTSHAVDAGVAGSTQTDQRGLARKVDYPGVPTATAGDSSDIGAFELQAP